MKEFIFNNRKFTLVDDVDNFSMAIVDTNNGVETYKISINDNKKSLCNVTLRFYLPMKGHLSYWSPVSGRDNALRQWHSKNKNYSNFYYGAPEFSVVDTFDNNYLTLALSDDVNPSMLSCYVDDFADNQKNCAEITLFSDYEFSDSDYSVFLRTDTRKINYCQTVSDVSVWWKSLSERKIHNNDFASNPLYSSWYNFHQHPSDEKLTEELELASSLGMKTFILDDGWSYNGIGTGDYRNCGNWNFSAQKFRDFVKFTEKIHQFGMKVMLWLPVPFVGYDTEDYEKFKDKLLYNAENFKAGVLDPRYSEVRNYLVDTYLNFVRKYNLDGLKLDFIDSFKLTYDSPEFNGKMDCRSVEEAVIRLLDDISANLKKINKNILIEFRQFYLGNRITDYCNMLRVNDCCSDSITNRIGVADLRLINHDLSVHSDMLYWADDESDENVARQLLDIMFSVPQISVCLKRQSSSKLKIMKAFLDYWTQHKDIIMNGTFTAKHPESNYTALCSEKTEGKVCVLYAVNSYKYTGKNEDIFNATYSDDFYIELCSSAKLTVIDMYGNVVKSKIQCKGVCKINVPFGGRVEIRSV